MFDLIYVTTFTYLFMSNLYKLLLLYMLYVYVWCENDSAIENSLMTNYVTDY